jgi:hypothetical protein
VGPVTEQSEHLSSAQIENYGNRASGAGPDTAQGDERQRIDHQSNDDLSMNDQRVEAHLADCASCRNRVLDFHRRRFALLAQPERAGSASSSPGLANSRLAEERPTDSALADSKFANSKYPADPQVRTAPTPECPSSDALRQLAAGLTPDALAAKLTQHAATCDHCGPLLRTFTEDFSDDFTPEEQAALANLRSSSAKWQKTTARKMLEAGGVKTIVEHKPFFWKWVLIPATAAVVAVAAITFPIYLAQRDTPEKAEKLLAQAYTEQRTMEMRWPGAKWGPVRVTRGAEDSRFAKPAALLKAERIVNQHQSADSRDVQWLRAAAQAEILKRNPAAAISSLNQALKSQLASVLLRLDLAIAYEQQGEISLDSRNYAEAIEQLNHVLETEPENLTALFNRALVYERMKLIDKAIADWQIFLQKETDPGWSGDARKRLLALQSKK